MHLEKDPSLKKPQKLFFVLFGLLFLIAPFYYQPNMGGEGLFLPYNSSIWIVACWIIAAASMIVYRTQELILPKHWLGLAMLPIGAVLTGFIAENNNPSEWLVRLSVIIGGYLFLISLYQFRLNSRHIERSLYIILAFGIIAGCYGVIQTQPHSNLKEYLPFSPSNIPVGIFQQVNLQASMMATLLVLVYYLISRPAVRSMGLAVKIALALAALLASFIIAQSGSRVGLLGAFVGVILIFVGRGTILLRTNKKILISVLIATFAGAYIGASGLTSTFNKLDRTMGGVSTDVRWQIYSLSWNIFLEKPILGHGLGSFQKVFQEHRGNLSNSDRTLALKESPRYSHPHNELIFWMVEGGLVSIIGIIVAALVTIQQFWSAGWQRGSSYAAIAFPLILHTQVELPFYISNTHWLLLIFTLFIVHQHGKYGLSTSTLSTSAKGGIALSGTFVAIISSTFLIHSQLANANIIKYLQTKYQTPQLLLLPLENPYFRNLSTRFLLVRQMHIYAKKGKKDQALEFLGWAKQNIEITPDVGLFIQMAFAYEIIGDIHSRNEMLNRAAAIYKGHKPLDRLITKINNNQPITIYALNKPRAQPPASQPQSD